MPLLLVNEDGTYATPCAICEKPLSEPIFATSHFIGDPSDKLFDYSDAGMHWNCYANWEHQKRFANMYFDSIADSDYKNPYWAVVLIDDEVRVQANCDLNPPVADLYIRRIGPGPRVNLNEWESWIGGSYRDDCPHALATEAIADVIRILRDRLPTFEVIKRIAAEVKRGDN